MGAATLHFQSVCEEDLDKGLNDSEIYTFTFIFLTY